MRKLLVCVISVLFSVSVFAQFGSQANMQGYADCIKKNEAKINEAKTFCDTEAKVRLNQAKCMEITKISLKCSCDNNFNADPKACATLKTGKVAPAAKKAAKKIKKAAETM